GALAALRTYLDSTGSPPGELRLEDDPDTGVRYVYRASDALLLGGKKVDGGGVSLDAVKPAELFITWSDPNGFRIWASTTLTTTINLEQVFGSTVPHDLAPARSDGQPVSVAGRTGNTITLKLDSGGY